MMEEVLAQKITSLQRCVARAREALEAAGAGFETNFNLQDAALLNVVRACETAIDLANMLIRQRRLGIPTQSRESFGILVRERLIAPDLGERLQKIIGFRNLAVHRYRDLDLAIVRDVIATRLDDLLLFAECLRKELAADGKQ
jgi:uncharacterized protein YutE (UPF0331/DUF86 family)